MLQRMPERMWNETPRKNDEKNGFSCSTTCLPQFGEIFLCQIVFCQCLLVTAIVPIKLATFWFQPLPVSCSVNIPFVGMCVCVWCLSEFRTQNINNRNPWNILLNAVEWKIFAAFRKTAIITADHCNEIRMSVVSCLTHSTYYTQQPKTTHLVNANVWIYATISTSIQMFEWNLGTEF